MPTSAQTRADRPRRLWAKRGRWLGGWAFSLGAHALIVAGLVGVYVGTAPQPQPPVIELTFEPAPPPVIPPPPKPTPDLRPALAPAKDPAPTKAPAKAPIPAKAPPPASHARSAPAPAPSPIVAGKAQQASVSGPGLSEAQLAGAGTAESGSSGGGGGECNMIRRLQAALRKDPLVQAAVAQASGSGKPLWVWNGDWVQSGGEDGKGLAAVREAIMWEIAFAPAACRAEPVRGLIVVSMSGAPGSARLAVGQSQWRWSDLLR